MDNHDKIHLHYEKKIPPDGTSSNRCVVFLHGGGGNGELWHNQTDYFSSYNEVITVDLPGAGCSTKKIDPGSAIAVTVAVLRDFIRKEVASNRVTLVGHSYAGSVMIEFQNNPPAGVDSLVFVDSTFISSTDEARKRKAFASSLLTMPAESMTRRIREWYGVMMGGKLSKIEGQLVLNALDQTDPVWLLQTMVATSVVHESRGGLTTDQQEIVEVGIIESDFFAGDNPQSWRNYFQHYHYCYVKGTSHFLFMERPEEFNQCLERFLDQLH